MIHSFLMVGQSNMAGRGFITDVPPIYSEKINMLRNGRWQMMTEPINYDRPVAGVSLAGSFAQAWSHDHPEQIIGLIPCAEGGSSIDEWATDGLLFRNAIAQTKFAMENSQLSAILWHQGESDSTERGILNYPEKLKHVLLEFRAELASPDLPIIIGGLSDFLGQTGFGKSCTHWSTINQMIQEVAQEIPNCYFITASALTANPDGIHLDALSQRRFGLRYYQGLTTATDILVPLTNEGEQLTTLAQTELTANEELYLASLNMALGKTSYETFEKAMLALYRPESQEQ